MIEFKWRLPVSAPADLSRHDRQAVAGTGDHHKVGARDEERELGKKWERNTLQTGIWNSRIICRL